MALIEAPGETRQRTVCQSCQHVCVCVREDWDLSKDLFRYLCGMKCTVSVHAYVHYSVCVCMHVRK